MVRLYLVLLLCASLCITTLARPDGEMYSTKYDNMDIDEILSSERLLTSYYNCLMDEGPCSPEGADLKKVIPDAMKDKCAKCSEKQKEAAKKVANFIIDNKPDWYKAIEAKYDPTGEYRKEHEAEAREHGIHV